MSTPKRSPDGFILLEPILNRNPGVFDLHSKLENYTVGFGLRLRIRMGLSFLLRRTAPLLLLIPVGRSKQISNYVD